MNACHFLGIMAFLGVFLVRSIRSFNCPIWQWPAGVTFLICAVVASFNDELTWNGLFIGWLGGAGLAIALILIADVCDRRSLAKSEKESKDQNPLP